MPFVIAPSMPTDVIIATVLDPCATLRTEVTPNARSSMLMPAPLPWMVKTWGSVSEGHTI